MTTKDYEYEMNAVDHAELLATLATLKGKFLLSGYPSTMYEQFRADHGWYVHTCEIDNKASSSKVKAKKTECLWMNYDPIENAARGAD